MSDFVIVNGFDRAGTSAITRTLAIHPNIELIMQPFNSGFLRKKMYQPLKEEDENSTEHRFFCDLRCNKLNNALISSDWHEKYSTTYWHKPGQIHLIKTTINHLAQKWMKEYYPEIGVWGIWRDPYDVLDSLVRNKYHLAWYKGAVTELKGAVESVEFLRVRYLKFYPWIRTSQQELALIFAVRTHFFLHYLDVDKLFVYEKFIQRPNEELGRLISMYDLVSMDFSQYSGKDLNIVGERTSDEESVIEEDALTNDILSTVTRYYVEMYGPDSAR